MLQTFGEWTDGVTLIPGDRGAFEISVNGEEIYSKLKTGHFPDLDELNQSIQKLLE